MARRLTPAQVAARRARERAEREAKQAAWRALPPERQIPPDRSVLHVTVDYHQVDEDRWTAMITLDELPDEVLDEVAGEGPTEVFREAMACINELADHAGRYVATIHTLDGSPEAWATLAQDLDLDQHVDDTSQVAFIHPH